MNKRRRIVNAVKRDLEKYGGYDEKSIQMKPFLEAVWKSVGNNLSNVGTGTPWSAAAISYWMLDGGAKDFPYNSSHSWYIVEARKNTEEGRKEGEGKMSLYRLDEHKPRIGDLLCQWRNKQVNYDTVQYGDATHVDIVIEVNKDHVVAVGGNVGDTIKARKFYTDSDGYLLEEQSLFAIIKNKYVL